MGLAFRVFDVVVYSLAEVWVVALACSWSFLVSMGWAFRVFEVVGASAGRGVGRCTGRLWCRWCVPQACSTSVFDDVGVTAGRGVGGRVVYLWSLLVSMVRDICVFEHVRWCG